MNTELLTGQIQRLSQRAGVDLLAVALHDFESGACSYTFQAERWFHAASVIKMAVLVALFHAAESGFPALDSELHVRNRFASIVDGSVFKIDRQSDGDSECHRHIGGTLKIRELARAMIVRSSNLATNLLLDLLGIAHIRQTLERAKIPGVRMVRGVEDRLAFERGLNNQMTATGAASLFRLLCEGDFLNASSRAEIRDILLAQEFNSMLPAALPPQVRVAHKTGEISTHCHDAGVIYCPGRAPYVLAVLSEGPAGQNAARARVIAEISGLIFAQLTE